LLLQYQNTRRKSDAVAWNCRLANFSCDALVEPRVLTGAGLAGSISSVARVLCAWPSRWLNVVRRCNHTQLENTKV
jgi:hypothetical protein